MAQRDESGRIRPDGLRIARAQAVALRQRQNASTPLAGISNTEWTWLGPGNAGGRTRGISVNPANTSDIVIGAATGGIWRSLDAGASWAPFDDFMASLSVTTIVRKPDDPLTLLAGTGEETYSRTPGAGIFRSVDGGQSWSLLTGPASTAFVHRLAFSADGSVALAATSTGLWRTLDTGVSWTLVLNDAAVTDVEFLPGSSTRAVGSGGFWRTYYSVDGGQSWLQATVPPPPGGSAALENNVELGASIASPLMVYASAAVSFGSSEIWKSTDGGASYVRLQASSFFPMVATGRNTIWVDPTDANHVVVGGVWLERSTDGGMTFTLIEGNVGSDYHAIIGDPDYDGSLNRKAYYGSGSGISRLEDSLGENFTPLNNNYGVTQFYSGAGWHSTGVIVGGAQDTRFWIYTPALGPHLWQAPTGGRGVGGYVSVDQSSPDYFYWATPYLRVNRGFGEITGCSFPPFSTYTLRDACMGLANFIAPLLLDPNEPNRLYGGGNSLWRTNDARTPNGVLSGPDWDIVKGPEGQGNYISAIAVATGNSNLVWVGHGSDFLQNATPGGDVFKTVTGTDTLPAWTKMDDNPGPLPNRAVTSIAIDPANTDVVYVSFGGFSSGNLWKTTNGGITWTDASGAAPSRLPDVPIRSVVIHPSVSNWVYVGTEIGVFASEDGGSTWQVPHQGPANVAVFQLFWVNWTLVAATHGRGMFAVHVPLPATPPVISVHPASATIAPGQTVTLSVVADGTPPLSYQWYLGSSPNTSTPIAGATATSFTTPVLSTSTSYWVRVSNAFGVASSHTADLTSLLEAQYDPQLGAPRCTTPGNLCDSGLAQLNGRGNMSGGAEPHQPNTIAVEGVPCADDLQGTYHLDSSVDRLRVFTLDGGSIAPGKTVRVEATVWASNSQTPNAVNLYYAASVTNPTFVPLAVFTPLAPGQHVLTADFVLPAGTVQVVRARIAPQANSAPSGCAVAQDADHDDLAFVASAEPDAEMIRNGDFAIGVESWQIWEPPDIVWSIGFDGLDPFFQFYKQSPPSTASRQAAVFQTTGLALASATPVRATFDLGNNSSVRKRIAVLITDSTFGDLYVCSFFLPANAPLRTYEMRTRSNRPWANAAIYFYAASAGSNGGAYLLDNVSMRVDVAMPVSRTDCIDPTAPEPPGGSDSGNLLANGDFSAGLPPWFTFGALTSQIMNGVFEFFRPSTPGPAGLVAQNVGPVPGGETLSATFQLGNSSAQRVRVTVILNDADFTDLAACTFWVPAGQPLTPYTMRTFTTQPWTDGTVSVYSATIGLYTWSRLDEVVLRRTPSVAAVGTECIEPVSTAPAALPRVQSRPRSAGTRPRAAANTAPAYRARR